MHTNFQTFPKFQKDLDISYPRQTDKKLNQTLACATFHTTTFPILHKKKTVKRKIDVNMAWKPTQIDV